MKSKLEQLIAELCPDGVEFKLLNTFCKVYDGTHQTPTYTDSGIKFVSVENINDLYNTKKFISENDFAKFKVIPQINDVMMTRIGSIGVCSVIESNEPLAYYVSLALLRPNNKIVDSRYLKYIIESKHGRKELRKRTLVNAVPIKVNTGDIGMIKLPVPPLEVQREIVRVLDNFTFLSAELSAELSARRKQYEFYRNKLFLFSGQVVWKNLGDIGRISMCKRIMKNETSAEGDVPFYKIGTFGKQADAYISWETFNKYRSQYSYPKKGSILISAAGTIGRTVVFDGRPAYFQDSNIVWVDNDESQVLNTFLYYWYQTNPWKASTGGTIARLYNDNIAKAKVPVLPMEVQRRIVRTLDNFDAVCNDLNIGLPAEINARKKQYEYYRDFLLTVVQKGDSILTDRQTDRQTEHN